MPQWRSTPRTDIDGRPLRRDGNGYLGAIVRLYYLTSTEHAISNIEKRRVKISDVMKLNDPFEFMGINLQDKALRRAMQKTKSEMAAVSGLICFSRSWQHPMMWSHYGDRHQGVCLGFDVADKWCCEVQYVKERVHITQADVIENRVSDRAARKLVSTKAHFWKYEQEVRVFCSTAERDEAGHAFREFDDDLVLREVIVGPESQVLRSRVSAALGDLGGSVSQFKSRIAFGHFEVCRNKNEALWI
jgi:hypothetical protein